jgi:hypothetical protein
MTTVLEAFHMIKIEVDTDRVQLASRPVNGCLQLGKNCPPIWIIRD